MSVDIKEAVARAESYLVGLFPVQGEVELEEVEPNPTSSGWRITFSYDRAEPDPLSAFFPHPKKRIYKVVSVNGDGQPESVKMRS